MGKWLSELDELLLWVPSFCMFLLSFFNLYQSAKPLSLQRQFNQKYQLPKDSVGYTIYIVEVFNVYISHTHLVHLYDYNLKYWKIQAKRVQTTFNYLIQCYF